MLSCIRIHFWVEFYQIMISLIARITEFIYNIGRTGWSSSDITLLRHLILKHNILTEEVEGMKSCIVTLHNLINYPYKIE